jgi:hypothetical protein
MASNLSPRDQIETLMNESFGERNNRKFLRICVTEFDSGSGAEQTRFLEEFFYLSDEECVEVCRGLINGLKPFASRRADREGRPKSVTVGPNGARNNARPNAPAQERELVHN